VLISKARIGHVLVLLWGLDRLSYLPRKKKTSEPMDAEHRTRTRIWLQMQTVSLCKHSQSGYLFWLVSVL
jgi:hypothetical protein